MGGLFGFIGHASTYSNDYFITMSLHSSLSHLVEKGQISE